MAEPQFCQTPSEIGGTASKFAAPIWLLRIGDNPANKLRTVVQANVRQLRHTGDLHDAQYLVKTEVCKATEDVDIVHHMGQLEARLMMHGACLRATFPKK